MKEELSLKIDKELAEIKKQLIEKYSPKPQFEVGQYIIAHLHYDVARITKVENGGVTWNSIAGVKDGYTYSQNARPATPEEVKQALVKEAERRGFKEGVEILAVGVVNNMPVKGAVMRLTSNKWSYYSSSDELTLGDIRVYCKGQWAEIIPQEEVIKIGGFEVKFHDKEPCLKPTTSIDGHEFPKEFWQAAKVVAEHSKAAVWVGCDAKTTGTHKWPAALPTIQKILKKLN